MPRTQYNHRDKNRLKEGAKSDEHLERKAVKMMLARNCGKKLNRQKVDGLIHAGMKK